MRNLVVLGLLTASFTAAAVPTTFQHQGRVLDSAGLPLDGAIPVTFKIYGTAAGGSPNWDETLTVDFDNGYFSVELGTTSGDELDTGMFSANDAHFLTLSVDGGADLADRVPLASVPYALVADSVKGGTVDATSVTVGGSMVIGTDGKIAAGSVTGLTDNDLLASLGCTAGEVAIVSTGGAWSCVDHDAITINASTQLTGVVPAAQLKFGGGTNDVARGDHGHTAAEIGAVAAVVPNGGMSSGDPGETCLTILNAAPYSRSGLYWIDPDDTGSPWETYCDMTADGGGWTLVAYAGDNSAGFPSMDIDEGTFNAADRTGKGSKGGVAVAKKSTAMALGYARPLNFSKGIEQMTDVVALVIPDPSLVDLVPAQDRGTCEQTRAWRIKPDGSNHACVGNYNITTEGKSATDCDTSADDSHTGVWTRSLGGTYSGKFAYGVYQIESNCNSWPNVSHHWWVNEKYYNWEPSATQYWAGQVDGTASIWFR